MDCGAACLATLCRSYGKRVSLNRLRELARVGTAGASMLHLMLAARQLGFEALPILSTLDHLRNNHLPALVNWKGFHWIVVYAIDDRRALVADPARGLVKIPIEDFTKGWTRYTLFVRPTPRFADLDGVAAHARSVHAVSRALSPDDPGNRRRIVHHPGARAAHADVLEVRDRRGDRAAARTLALGRPRRHPRRRCCCSGPWPGRGSGC